MIFHSVVLVVYVINLLIQFDLVRVKLLCVLSTKEKDGQPAVQSKNPRLTSFPLFLFNCNSAMQSQPWERYQVAVSPPKGHGTNIATIPVQFHHNRQPLKTDLLNTIRDLRPNLIQHKLMGRCALLIFKPVPHGKTICSTLLVNFILYF